MGAVEAAAGFCGVLHASQYAHAGHAVNHKKPLDTGSRALYSGNMSIKQLSVYLRPRDSAALDHIRTQTGVRSAAEVIRMALHAFARESGWEPPPPTVEDSEPMDVVGA